LLKTVRWPARLSALAQPPSSRAAKAMGQAMARMAKGSGERRSFNRLAALNRL
jgi:hypothetical protein